ncbi:hypothetical protein RHMOL_Rhmol03G0228100 [Rhododendron molle]|uniref:Uncharacterized protein n=1 Tax=Rhododendron molle TaxID=49168 RepID=A0ACC0PJP2_RHOML|nr:hypothetical protein RHMOL_Rhmol03G0228100 [Rhododendron molle]
MVIVQTETEKVANQVGRQSSVRREQAIGPSQEYGNTTTDEDELLTMNIKKQRNAANGQTSIAMGEYSGESYLEIDKVPSPSPRGNNARKVSVLPLVFLIFYEVSGGAFGAEDTVHAAGPLLALIGFLVFPFIWSVPEALITAELGTMFLEDGGYVVWVSSALGEYWGFQEGWMKWLSGQTEIEVKENQTNKHVHFLLCSLLSPTPIHSPRRLRSKHGPTIRFPLRLKDSQPPHCGYPGFDLSCSPRTSATLLNLPYSVQVLVTNIDYKSQSVRIKDPNKCLPQQLQNLNLSTTPFQYADSVYSFSLFGCPSTRPVESFEGPWWSTRAACLSGDGHEVYVESGGMSIDLFSTPANILQKDVGV